MQTRTATRIHGALLAALLLVPSSARSRPNYSVSSPGATTSKTCSLTSTDAQLRFDFVVCVNDLIRELHDLPKPGVPELAWRRSTVEKLEDLAIEVASERLQVSVDEVNNAFVQLQIAEGIAYELGSAQFNWRADDACPKARYALNRACSHLKVSSDAKRAQDALADHQGALSRVENECAKVPVSAGSCDPDDVPLPPIYRALERQNSLAWTSHQDNLGGPTDGRAEAVLLAERRELLRFEREIRELRAQEAAPDSKIANLSTELTATTMGMKERLEIARYIDTVERLLPVASMNPDLQRLLELDGQDILKLEPRELDEFELVLHRGNLDLRRQLEIHNRLEPDHQFRLDDQINELERQDQLGLGGPGGGL